MHKTVALGATILLLWLFVVSFLSSRDDSVIFDETAHIGGGYSYLTQRDMRLNPEHPPLVKDLAALPLLSQNIKFPTNTNAWQNQINGQWDQGGGLLFEFGNDPDRILQSVRLPIILLAIFTGALLFLWVRGLYGGRVAILTLFFYTFSPTVIAHSRFVTTDIAATLAFLIGIASFLRFLANHNPKRLVMAGIAFGIAQNLKYSLFLLIPIDLALLFFWLITKENQNLREYINLAFKTLGIFMIGAVIIWLVFLWHIWDYPQDRQVREMTEQVGRFKPQAFVSLDRWLLEHSATRPLGQYLMGVMMVTQRTAGGNSAYFLGEVSSNGWRTYFPTLYIFKEALAFHILTALALILACARVLRTRKKSWRAFSGWIQDNFALFASMFFIVFYWASSVANPLNIGIRHVLPTFPFIYLLVARELILWTGGVKRPKEFSGPLSVLRFIYQNLIVPLPRIFVLSLLMIWIVASIILNFPFYLSYYNELAGGTLAGWQIATDSNYDWGQDLKRLGALAKKDFPNETIYLHYFGGSSVNHGAQYHWLGEQYAPWYSSFGPPPSGSIFAISINELAGTWATPVGGFPTKPTQDSYEWLRELQPFGRAGTSIFLYRIP